MSEDLPKTPPSGTGKPDAQGGSDHEIDNTIPNSPRVIRHTLLPRGGIPNDPLDLFPQSSGKYHIPSDTPGEPPRILPRDEVRELTGDDGLGWKVQKTVPRSVADKIMSFADRIKGARTNKGSEGRTQ